MDGDGDCVWWDLSKIVFGIGSYGVVFLAVLREDYNQKDKYERDEDMPPKKIFAVKRIFPTINAPFILIEMLILKLIK